MNDKDKQIIKSYKNKETPEVVKNNTSKNGKIIIKDSSIPLEGTTKTLYDSIPNSKDKKPKCK